MPKLAIKVTEQYLSRNSFWQAHFFRNFNPIRRLRIARKPVQPVLDYKYRVISFWTLFVLYEVQLHNKGAYKNEWQLIPVGPYQNEETYPKLNHGTKCHSNRAHMWSCFDSSCLPLV